MTCRLRICAIALGVFAIACCVAPAGHAGTVFRGCSGFELDALRFQAPHVKTWRSLEVATKRTCSAVPNRYRWVDQQSFLVAASVADSVFPGTFAWERDCSASEGGWGQLVWNGPNGGIPFTGSLVPPPGSSGALGPMQFMAGTFYAHVELAFALARARGLVHAPRSAMAWTSKLGQAITAAYMYPGGRPNWTGGGC